MCDVIVKDCMNVSRAVKLFQDEVLERLVSKEEIGLCFYLRIMKSVYEPFLLQYQSAREVIYKIWYAAFALKSWRNIEMASISTLYVSIYENFICKIGHNHMKIIFV